MSARGLGMRALGETVAGLTQPIIGRRGAVRGAVIADWEIIVGERLAADSVPERVSYPPKRSSEGTLHLRVASGSLAMELQHFEPVLIERVNDYFGYRAIARVRLIQGPVARPGPRHAPPQLPALSANEEAALAKRVGAVSDDDLRGALADLGRAIIGRDDGRSGS